MSLVMIVTLSGHIGGLSSALSAGSLNLDMTLSRVQSAKIIVVYTSENIGRLNEFVSGGQ